MNICQKGSGQEIVYHGPDDYRHSTCKDCNGTGISKDSITPNNYDLLTKQELKKYDPDNEIHKGTLSDRIKILEKRMKNIETLLIQYKDGLS